MPKAERERIEIEEELFGFVTQSRISQKNRERLKVLLEYEDANITELASLILKVSLIAEGKRKRWRKVRQEDFELYQACEKAGLTYYPY